MSLLAGKLSKDRDRGFFTVTPPASRRVLGSIHSQCVSKERMISMLITMRLKPAHLIALKALTHAIPTVTPDEVLLFFLYFG